MKGRRHVILQRFAVKQNTRESSRLNYSQLHTNLTVYVYILLFSTLFNRSYTLIIETLDPIINKYFSQTSHVSNKISNFFRWVVHLIHHNFYQFILVKYLLFVCFMNYCIQLCCGPSPSCGGEMIKTSSYLNV